MNLQRALAWCVLGVALTGCDGSCNSADTPTTAPEGAAPAGAKRDVKAACEYRAAWKHRLATKCSKCLGYSSAPKCECKRDDIAYSGKCAAQKGMLDAEDACEAVYKCEHKCKPTECDCKAKCFEGADKRCRELVEAFEACTIEICEPFCG